MISKIIHAVNKARSDKYEKQKTSLLSQQWIDLRNEFLRANPRCEACRSQKNLQVHHIIPVEVRPDLELDILNLVVLCMDTNECYLQLGRGGRFDTYNPRAREHCEKYLSEDVVGRLLIIEESKMNRLFLD